MLPPNVVTFFHPEPLNMCSSAKIEVIEGSPKLVENKNTVYIYIHKGSVIHYSIYTNPVFLFQVTRRPNLCLNPNYQPLHPSLC